MSAADATSPPASEHDDRERRLTELLEQLTAELRGGRHPMLDEICRAHADLADELRSLWPAVLIAEGLAANDIPTPQTRQLRSALAGLPGQSLGEGEFPRRFGDYDLLAELGRGGMGVVYRARQRSLDRVVALKLILGGKLAPAADIQRFHAEAQAAARLNHPGIVPVYEVDQLEGQPYFTMKFVGGTTLAHRLADGPLPPREGVELLAAVCRAVHHAHEHGVLHRDLKPSNILIDTEGRPHVTDFGLAKRFNADTVLTLTGAAVGTPCYMPPEQAAGARGQFGPPSDVYSLGTILYQMLTGRPPFQAASPVDTLLLVLEQDPLPPRLLNPRADRQLEMVALKCLQKPPELRYPTAAALADDLEAWLADEPVAARSGAFGQVMARLLRETHHATVLENWGLLWMWHSLALLVICLATNLLQWQGVTARLPYLALWIAALGTWAAIFWQLRHRSGPVTFVERQIAHVWAGSMIAIAMLFGLEALMQLKVLTLSPVLGLVSGTVFLVKAGILSGRFYLHSAALFVTAPLMALLDRYGWPVSISLFGVVSAACFFLPGLKYYRQRRAVETAGSANAILPG